MIEGCVVMNKSGIWWLYRDHWGREMRVATTEGNTGYHVVGVFCLMACKFIPQIQNKAEVAVEGLWSEREE